MKKAEKMLELVNNVHSFKEKDNKAFLRRQFNRKMRDIYKGILERAQQGLYWNRAEIRNEEFLNEIQSKLSKQGFNSVVETRNGKDDWSFYIGARTDLIIWWNKESKPLGYGGERNKNERMVMGVSR